MWSLYKIKGRRQGKRMKLEVFLFISPTCGLCPLVEQRLLGVIEKNKLPIKIKMKIDGVCDQVLLEELILNYYVNSYKFHQVSVSSIPAD